MCPPPPGRPGGGEWATITTATMKLTMVSGTSLAYNANAYQVTGGEWGPTTIQWTNKPAADVLLESNISNNDRTKYQFSVLTAVQHWYDGDPTGQNENYGIMLRYYDETLTGYYNSVYSGDVVDTNSRPRLTISYKPPNYSVDLGDTLALSVSGASGTVTWTSSNTSVATVNSSGVVTGVKVGVVTITASVNGSVFETFTIYVTVADGVYRIQSSVGLYLSTYGGLSENTEAKLRSYLGTGLELLYQLWKIAYLGNGYYSIRPMYKTDKGLHANGVTGGSVDVVSIGSNDSLAAVPALSYWSISTNTAGTGYYIYHMGSANFGLRPVSYAPSQGMSVTISNNNGSESYFSWALIEVSDPPSGVAVYDLETEEIISWPSGYITVGSTVTLEDIGLAFNVYSGDRMASDQIVWTKESGASCLSINQITGVITGIARGTALITGATAYGNIEVYITVTSPPTTDFVFINHYDSTFLGDTELIGYIDEAVGFVNQCFQRQFGVAFDVLTVPYYREKNLVVSCPNGDNVSCHDESVCGSLCNSEHHKNKYLVANSLYSSDIPDNHVLVFWTNHASETYCADNFLSESAAGVYNHRPVIHFMVRLDSPVTEEQDETLLGMSLTLAHEFTHTLGMEDLYYTEHEKYNTYECVMQSYQYYHPDNMWDFYEKVKDGDGNLFCTSCANRLSELIREVQ